MGRGDTYPLLLQLQTAANTKEVSIKVLQKLELHLPYDPAISPQTIHPQIWGQRLQGNTSQTHLHISAYCSTIHNS